MFSLRHWLDGAPAWLGPLFQHLRTDTRFEWLSESNSAVRSAELRSILEDGIPLGYALSDAVASWCFEQVEGVRVLAEGPVRRDFQYNIDVRSMLVYDPSRPETPWFALDGMGPPLLWIGAGPDVATLETVLERYFNDVECGGGGRLAMPALLRRFVGTPQLIGSEFEELENYFTITACINRIGWGSEFDEDPWPCPLTETNPLVISTMAREYTRQRPGRVRSTSWTTLWSRSIVSLEDHAPYFVLQVRYRPITHPNRIAELNGRFDAGYPEDMPADVLGSVLGFLFEPADELRSLLEDPTREREIGFNLGALAAVEHTNLPALAADLRRYATHPDPEVRFVVTDVAWRLNYDFLLREMFATETDPELAAELARLCSFTDPAAEGAMG